MESFPYEHMPGQMSRKIAPWVIGQPNRAHKPQRAFDVKETSWSAKQPALLACFHTATDILGPS
jgi:hypothetical protein